MCKRSILRSGPGGDVSRSRVVARASGPDLLDDPFPAPISACLAKTALQPPSGPDWLFEVKWDGYRLFIERHPDGRLVLRTRGGNDWTDRFPGILAAAGNIPADTFILDGEAVVLNDQGVSDFAALQSAARRRSSGEVLFYGFDLLYRDGMDLRRLPLVERRAALADIIGEDPHLRMSETVEADGAAFLAAACEMKLEGIIAKRARSPYRSGRGGDWRKIKCFQTANFLVIGYKSSRSSLGGLARLYLAAREGDDVRYVGTVGTGFSERSAGAILQRLRPLRQSEAVTQVEGGKATWVRPEVIAEISFLGMTGEGGKLRHASFKRLLEAGSGEADIADLSA
ncbi:MAG: non-homologous end-joining DNA ligase [Parvibaculaceae bacterium]